VNYAMREACNRCQTPKPEQQPGPIRIQFGGKGAPIAGVDGNWSCPQCQNVNYAMRAACNVCQMPKPEQQPGPIRIQVGGKGAPVAGVDGNWACPQCRNVNYAMREACNRCQTPKPEQQPGPIRPLGATGLPGSAPVAGVAGNWACPQCHNVNYAIREECNRCSFPKPDEENALAKVLAPSGISGRCSKTWF